MEKLMIIFATAGLFLSGCSGLSRKTNEANLHRSPSAAALERQYFKGIETNYKTDGTTVNYSVQYYCQRVLDQGASVLTEHTLLVFENGKSTEFDTQMSISNDGSTFTVVDPTNFVSGGGNFFGSPWAWNGMTAIFKRKNGMRTEDTNVLSNDFIAGLKKDYSTPTEARPSGDLLDIDIAILHKITQDEYEQVIARAHAKQ